MFALVADLFRLGRAGWMLARHDALLPREYAHMLPAPARALGALSRIGARGDGLRPGERLAKALEKLGPAYVKAGQFLATRPDVIGFELAADLGRLQDRMPAFSNDRARETVAAALGSPVEERFTHFSDPVAAASIAQVHKAQDGVGGAVLAVKILRPGVEREVAREFRALARVARMVEAAVPPARRLEPVKFIAALAESARLELDLRMEAAACSELAAFHENDPEVRCPEVAWSHTSRRTFALEWIDGAPVRDLEALDRAGHSRTRLAKTVIRAFLRQALEGGFFHADMHQGNLMIDGEARLVLLDFGIMGRLGIAERRYLAEILYGFISQDYHRAAKAHFAAGYVPAHHSVDAFAQALRAVGEPVFGRDAAAVDMSRLMQQLFDVTALFDMRLRPELVLLQRTMVTVEGVARALHPRVNIWEAAQPVVERFVTERLGPKGRIEEAREAAIDMIDLLPKLPHYIEMIGVAAERVSDDRIGLSHETMEELAEAVSRQGRLTRRAMWFAGFGTIALAAVLYFG